MGRSNKCFGLLLVLFIIFGLSLSVSLDINALKYPIDSIPFYPSTYSLRKIQDYQTGDDIYTYFERSNSMSIYSVRNSGDFPDGFVFPHSWLFTGQGDTNCLIPAHEDNFYSDYYYSNGVGVSYYSGADSYGYYLRPPQAFDYSSYFDYYDIISFESPFNLSLPLVSQYSSLNYPIDSHFSNIFCSMVHGLYYGSNEIVPPAFSNMPTWNWSSLINIPLVNNRLEYEKSKPYTYQFDTIFLNSSYKSEDGLSFVRNGIKMSEIFGTTIPTFSMLHLPLSDFNEAANWLDPDLNPDVGENVYQFDVIGSIIFDSDYSLGTYSGVVLDVRNYYNPYLTSSDLSDYEFTINGHNIYSLPSHDSGVLCDINEYHILEGDSENRLDFKCHYDPILENAFSEIIDFRFMSITLGFNGNGSGSWYFDKFLETDGDYTLKDFAFVTNNDFTDSGWSGSSTGSGGNISSAPGTAPGTGDDENFSPDFFSSLKNMFTFNFFNPFAPIFSMFSDNTSCAQIPIIAGLLHSNETQVCPWFNSDVRNILTPVFGITSIMLVFGFAVRWLGSSSGNMFTDSANEEVSNQGGRWGRFKKGG